MLRACEYCGQEIDAERSTKRFCSSMCAQRKARGWPKERACRHCGASFLVRDRSDANRQHCSKQCAKNHAAKTTRGWMAERPEAMKRYNANRVAKDPDVWKRKDRLGRQRSLELLGGRCVVCGVDNLYWLHIDFKEGSRGLRFRHPRHFAYIRQHADEFRVLCANHHYELTLTGRIEGTSITQ